MLHKTLALIARLTRPMAVLFGGIAVVLLNACTMNDIQSRSITSSTQMQRSQSFVISAHSRIAVAIPHQSKKSHSTLLQSGQQVLEKYFSQATIVQQTGSHSLNDVLDQALINRSHFLVLLSTLEGAAGGHGKDKHNKHPQKKSAQKKDTQKKKAKNYKRLQKAESGTTIKAVLYDVAAKQVLDIAVISFQRGLLAKEPPLEQFIHQAMTHYAERLVWHSQVAMH